MSEQLQSDVVEVFATHRNLMKSPLHPLCETCGVPWPCVTYRLALQVHEVQAVLLTRRGEPIAWDDLAKIVWPS